MQTFILPDFPEIVEKRSKRFPGGISRVAKELGIGRSAMYDKMRRRSEFTVRELKLLDTILHFTEEEKQLIWR